MKKIKKVFKINLTKIILAAIVILLGSYGLTQAGSLTPSSAPAGTMYTLNDIYTRLSTNATATSGNHSLSTSTSPAASMHTLTEIYGAIPTIDPTKVLSGTTYLGVAGTAASSSVSASPLKTGQTNCYDPSGSTNNTVNCSGTGQDGDLLRGVAMSYTDNGNNTVTDNSTKLTWIKDPAVIGSPFGDGVNTPTAMTFADALTNCEALSYASHTDWHLPNIRELLSLVDYSLITPTPSINALFTDTQTDNYWSSTSYEYPTFHINAWQVNFADGNSFPDGSSLKSNTHFVRCVRG